MGNVAVQLQNLLINMPHEDKAEILSTIREADIARLSGSKHWRFVFKRQWELSRGKKRKIYSALFKSKSKVALDSAWENG